MAMSQEKIKEHIAMRNARGHEHYIPLVRGPSDALALFVTLSITEYERRKVNNHDDTRAEKTLDTIPFSFAVYHQFTDNDYAEREVRKLIANMRSTLSRNRKNASNRARLRKFTMKYVGWQQDAMNESILIVTVNYVDNQSYNTIAKSSILKALEL